MAEDNRDYYCSMKFKWLKIDLAARTTYNCHAAAPHPVNFDWLSNNAGNLFNSDVNITERQQMLVNQRNKSCEQNCWAAEDVGANSPRLYQGGTTRTHTEVITDPEIIDITVGADCNLTCSYCCKEFSTSWRRDILSNGDYVLPEYDDLNRYCASNTDRILHNISQPKLKSTTHYQMLLDEVRALAPISKNIIVTGGEPFLDNGLVDMLSSLEIDQNCQVEIYTGLGVDRNRLQRILKSIKHLPGLVIRVSAETIGNILEFNRYGIKWNDFQEKINDILGMNINLKFHSTITNLTVFGFRDFYEYYNKHPIIFTFAYQPSMMAPYVLDTKSKELILKDFSDMPDKYKRPIEQTLRPDPTETDRRNMSAFLKEFVKRRPDLDVNIYPQEFLKWLEIENVV